MRNFLLRACICLLIACKSSRTEGERPPATNDVVAHLAKFFGGDCVTYQLRYCQGPRWGYMVSSFASDPPSIELWLRAKVPPDAMPTLDAALRRFVPSEVLAGIAVRLTRDLDETFVFRNIETSVAVSSRDVDRNEYWIRVRVAWLP